MSKLSPLLSLKIGNPNAIDTSKFSQRIQNIEKQIFAQQENIETIYEGQSSIEQQYQTIQNVISQIQSSINELTKLEIPQKSSKAAKIFKNQKQIIDFHSISFNNEHNNIRDKVSSTSNSFASFSSKFSEYSSNLKSQLTSLKNENLRYLSNYEKSINKITSVEKKNTTVEEAVQKRSEELNAFDANLTQNFSDLNSNISSLMTDYSNFLAKEIQTQSEYRNSVSKQLSEQANALNQKVLSSITQIIEENQTLSNSFKESLESLKSSISSSVNEIQDKVDSLLNEQNDRLDLLITQSENDFRSIRDEIIETMNDMKTISGSAFDLIEDALHIEASTRKENTEQIKQKYKNFDEAVYNELKVQNKSFKSRLSKIVKKEINEFDLAISPSRKENNILTNFVDKIDKYESDITNIESTVFSFNDQTNRAIQN